MEFCMLYFSCIITEQRCAKRPETVVLSENAPTIQLRGSVSCASYILSAVMLGIRQFHCQWNCGSHAVSMSLCKHYQPLFISA